jgi:hypothetical protein
MTTKQLTIWFGTVCTIFVLWGVVFAFFGLEVLPVKDRAVLLPWESALYGAIMMGWGVTLLLVGRVALQRHDAELARALWYGIAVWLATEAGFSAYFRVWFNVGVDVVVFALFSYPLLHASRSGTNKTRE